MIRLSAGWTFIPIVQKQWWLKRLKHGSRQGLQTGRRYCIFAATLEQKKLKAVLPENACDEAVTSILLTLRPGGHTLLVSCLIKRLEHQRHFLRQLLGVSKNSTSPAEGPRAQGLGFQATDGLRLFSRGTKQVSQPLGASRLPASAAGIDTRR